MKLSRDMHGCQRMNPNDFSELMSFHEGNDSESQGQIDTNCGT